MTKLLTVLNYSGGVQSTAILELVLAGDIKVSLDKFLVMSADPGMEDSRTYAHMDRMRPRVLAAGITWITTREKNLYKDLINISVSGRTRMDNPPFWTKKKNGKLGQLSQKCTREYKIRPMDRAIRRHLLETQGIAVRGRVPGYVEKWIGFGADEQHRVKEPSVKYQRFAYPLIERGLDRDAVNALYTARGWSRPPRSVCVACFANDSAFFEDMRVTRPGDFEKAVAVDEAFRAAAPQIGITEEVFVSRNLVPLRRLHQKEFSIEDRAAEAASCDSGYCFT